MYSNSLAWEACMNKSRSQKFQKMLNGISPSGDLSCNSWICPRNIAEICFRFIRRFVHDELNIWNIQRICLMWNTFVARASVELSLGSPHFGLKIMLMLAVHTRWQVNTKRWNIKWNRKPWWNKGLKHYSLIFPPTAKIRCSAACMNSPFLKSFFSEKRKFDLNV